jgi:uncharacterized protein
MNPKIRKLLIFGAVWFSLFLGLGLGLELPYLKAYSLVHPARTQPEWFPQHAYREVEFPSAGLTLRGWYIPPQNGAVVIFVHGLGANRSELVGEADLVAEAGYGALLFDLRNHGQSDGTTTTLGLAEADDVQAAARFVRRLSGDSIKLALCGHSMGGAAVLLAAAKIPEVRAIITESAYTSVSDNIAASLKGLTGLPPFPFAPLIIFFGQREAGVAINAVSPVAVIGQISPRALFIIHGVQDKLIPVENAYRLYAAARQPKEIYSVPEAGHFPLMNTERRKFARRVLGFLDRYLRP